MIQGPEQVENNTDAPQRKPVENFWAPTEAALSRDSMLRVWFAEFASPESSIKIQRTVGESAAFQSTMYTPSGYVPRAATESSEKPASSAPTASFQMPRAGVSGTSDAVVPATGSAGASSTEKVIPLVTRQPAPEAVVPRVASPTPVNTTDGASNKQPPMLVVRTAEGTNTFVPVYIVRTDLSDTLYGPKPPEHKRGLETLRNIIAKFDRDNDGSDSTTPKVTPKPVTSPAATADGGQTPPKQVTGNANAGAGGELPPARPANKPVSDTDAVVFSSDRTWVPPAKTSPNGVMPGTMDGATRPERAGNGLATGGLQAGTGEKSDPLPTAGKMPHVGSIADLTNAGVVTGTGTGGTDRTGQPLTPGKPGSPDGNGTLLPGELKASTPDGRVVIAAPNRSEPTRTSEGGSLGTITNGLVNPDGKQTKPVTGKPEDGSKPADVDNVVSIVSGTLRNTTGGDAGSLARPNNGDGREVVAKPSDKPSADGSLPRATGMIPRVVPYEVPSTSPAAEDTRNGGNGNALRIVPDAKPDGKSSTELPKVTASDGTTAPGKVETPDVSTGSGRNVMPDGTTVSGRNVTPEGGMVPKVVAPGATISLAPSENGETLARVSPLFRQPELPTRAERAPETSRPEQKVVSGGFAVANAVAGNAIGEQREVKAPTPRDVSPTLENKETRSIESREPRSTTTSTPVEPRTVSGADAKSDLREVRSAAPKDSVVPKDGGVVRDGTVSRDGSPIRDGAVSDQNNARPVAPKDAGQTDRKDTTTPAPRDIRIDAKDARVNGGTSMDPRTTTSSTSPESKGSRSIDPKDGRTPDSRTPDSRVPDARVADGRTADGRTADGRTADGRTADGRTADGRTADGRTADGRTADGRTADGRTADGRSADGRTADGRTVDTKHGRTPDTATTDGKDGRTTPAKDGRASADAKDGRDARDPVRTTDSKDGRSTDHKDTRTTGTKDGRADSKDGRSNGGTSMDTRNGATPDHKDSRAADSKDGRSTGSKDGTKTVGTDHKDPRNADSKDARTTGTKDGASRNVGTDHKDGRSNGGTSMDSRPGVNADHKDTRTTDSKDARTASGKDGSTKTTGATDKDGKSIDPKDHRSSDKDGRAIDHKDHRSADKDARSVDHKDHRSTDKDGRSVDHKESRSADKDGRAAGKDGRSIDRKEGRVVDGRGADGRAADGRVAEHRDGRVNNGGTSIDSRTGAGSDSRTDARVGARSDRGDSRADGGDARSEKDHRDGKRDHRGDRSNHSDRSDRTDRSDKHSDRGDARKHNADLADSSDKTDKTNGDKINSKDGGNNTAADKSNNTDKSRRQPLDINIAHNPFVFILDKSNKKNRKPDEQKESEETKQPKVRLTQQRIKYIVKEGDTLESIATEVLKDARFANLVLTINRAEVQVSYVAGRQEITLRVGQVLWLPTQSERDVYAKAIFSSKRKRAPQPNTPATKSRIPSREVIEKVKEESTMVTEPKSDPSCPISKIRQANTQPTVSLSAIDYHIGLLNKLNQAAESATTNGWLAHQQQQVFGTNVAASPSTQLKGAGSPVGPADSAQKGPKTQFPKFFDDEPANIRAAIDRLGDACRVVTVNNATNGAEFSTSLQMELNGVWRTIASYEYRQGHGYRYTFFTNTTARPFPMDLPLSVVSEMAREDFQRNWENYCLEFSKKSAETRP